MNHVWLCACYSVWRTTASPFLRDPISSPCFGRSIRNTPQLVHEVLGLCPQHDVLWSQLSVIEHLEFYAAIKGVPRRHIVSEAQRVCEEIGLRDKARSYAGTLSGGMQRKLSVGCALIGRSKLVVLDEPSSGMDPMSRSRMWELLR